MCYNVINRYTIYPLNFGVNIMKEITCCFFGHRTINETEELKLKLNEIIEKLIVEEKVNTFLLPTEKARQMAGFRPLTDFVSGLKLCCCGRVFSTFKVICSLK